MLKIINRTIKKFRSNNKKTKEGKIVGNYQLICMKDYKFQSGITLIVLVITIIVLLILAGIAINLSIANNGLFSRAKNAVGIWKNAELDEQSKIKNFTNTYGEMLNNIGLDKDVEKEEIKIDEITGDEKTNTETVDKNGNKIVIPAGFKVVNPDVTVEEGIVIEDAKANNNDTVGNQFVWIPCEIETEENKDNGKLKYDRYAFTRSGWQYRQTKLNSKDIEEVIKYKE